MSTTTSTLDPNANPSVIDYCSPNPCKNGGVCTSHDSGALCSCSANFCGECCAQLADDTCPGGGDQLCAAASSSKSSSSSSAAMAAGLAVGGVALLALLVVVVVLVRRSRRKGSHKNESGAAPNRFGRGTSTRRSSRLNPFAAAEPAAAYDGYAGDFDGAEMSTVESKHLGHGGADLSDTNFDAIAFPTGHDSVRGASNPIYGVGEEEESAYAELPVQPLYARADQSPYSMSSAPVYSFGQDAAAYARAGQSSTDENPYSEVSCEPVYSLGQDGAHVYARAGQSSDDGPDSSAYFDVAPPAEL